MNNFFKFCGLSFKKPDAYHEYSCRAIPPISMSPSLDVQVTMITKDSHPNKEKRGTRHDLNLSAYTFYTSQDDAIKDFYKLIK